MAKAFTTGHVFDEGTIVKLEIFEAYAQAWIPIVSKYHENITIYDFFANTGYDSQGTPGSAIRILDKINDHLSLLKKRNTQVKIVLNELNKEYFKKLSENIKKYLDNSPINDVVKIELFNKDFSELFFKLYESIAKTPSLIYLDQYGVKYLNNKFLFALEQLDHSDFLYFISSSSFARFGESEEFKKHINIDREMINKSPYRYIHNVLLNHIKESLPLNSQLKMYPFSIKKVANIYGIIFGTKHILAVDKFLSIAWKKNNINGSANFDIDDDLLKEQYNIFEGKKLTKIEKFERDFTDVIINGEIKNNTDAYHYALNNGFLGKHAAEVLKKLKKEKKINYIGISPYVTYENVYKKKKIINYEIL